MPRSTMAVRSAALAALFLTGVAVVHAEDTTRPGGEKTAFCEQCHGPKGCAPVQGLIPKLCGQNTEYLEAQLLMFQDGRRPQPIMHATANRLSADLVKQLAAYYSKIPCPQK